MKKPVNLKEKINDLAIFGGRPAFEAPLHVGRPNIGDKAAFLARTEKILSSGWLTNRGPMVQDLEAQLARYLGVKHCVAMCNGTLALEIAVRALELKGEVIVPSFTFVATAHALQWQEITPVFCDIDWRSYTLDASLIEKLVTPKTTGIIGVHLWGLPCDIEALYEIAHRRNLKLIFDASHAFGVTYKGKKIGSFGEAEVFSFHATKFMNTFEGGAVATNNGELAEKMRLMTNFGFSGYDNVIYVGTNGKMSEISAAMGLTNLEGIEGFIVHNRKNYELYREELEGIPGLKLIRFDASEKNNYQYIVVEVEEKLTGISRDRLIEILHAENVLARRYFFPGCHQMEPYRSYYPHASLLVPNTERIALRVLSLPNGTSVGPEEIRVICGIIRFALKHQSEIKAKSAA